MALVQVNARIEASLKDAGDAALQSLGWSATQAIRMFWAYLAAHKEDPLAIEQVFRAEGQRGQEEAAKAERARRLALVQEGAQLFYASCAKLGLDPDPSLWSGVGASEEGLLEEALYDALDQSPELPRQGAHGCAVLERVRPCAAPGRAISGIGLEQRGLP